MLQPPGYKTDSLSDVVRLVWQIVTVSERGYMYGHWDGLSCLKIWISVSVELYIDVSISSGICFE